jgi:hypothetical protein
MDLAIRTPSGKKIKVVSKRDARFRYDRFKKSAKKYLIYLIPFSFLISPFLFFLFVLYFFFNYLRFNKFFFENKTKRSYYKTILRPQLAPEVYSIPGYEVYLEDLDDHLSIIKTNDNKTLASKGNKMKKIPYMQVGFNIDLLTRHFAFIGTTGAGKTETLMSFFTDVIKNGGGLLMVDGKADTNMEMKIYELCESNGYETQFNAIILNEAEKRPETHTYSPFLTFTPFKLKMFISDLFDAISGGGGDGNADYFKNRGKVMFNNVVDFYKLRYDFYNESFTLSDLGGSIDALEYSNVYYMMFGTMIEIETILKTLKDTNETLEKYFEMAKKLKVPKYPFLFLSETLNEYINRNPQQAKEIEGLIGMDLRYFQNALSLFISLDEYMKGVYPTWQQYAQGIAFSIFVSLREEGKSYFYKSPEIVNMGDIRLTYQKLKSLQDTRLVSKIGMKFQSRYKIFPDSAYVETFIKNLIAGLGIGGQSQETIEKLNNDAMQQHSYAVQQWTKFFDMFKQYPHIFNTPYPEVDGDDIVVNNKVLYVMVPVMEYGSDEVKLLAKIFVLMVKSITASALGGEKQDAFDIQFRIYQNKIKPRPVFICVFDEWGSYATDGMSVILAQARSLLISVIISTQDKVSFKSTEEELKRAMANLSKIILQTKDEEMFDLLDKYIPEIEFIDAKDYMIDVNNPDELITSISDVGIEKKKAFDVKRTSEFGKGLGLLVVNDAIPVIMQSYYVGGNANKIYLRRFEGFREYLKRM